MDAGPFGPYHRPEPEPEPEGAATEADAAQNDTEPEGQAAAASPELRRPGVQQTLIRASELPLPDAGEAPDPFSELDTVWGTGTAAADP
jgi:hypothetical protein